MLSPVGLRWILLAVVALWVGGGIVFQSPSHGEINPVEAAQPRFIPEQHLELVLMTDGPSDMIGCLQHCWFAGRSESRLVLYRDHSGPEDRYHFGLLGQYRNKWYRTHEQNLSFPGAMSEDQPERSISLMATRLPEGHSWMYRWGIVQDHVITVGRVNDPDVTRIDLVHNTGQTTSPPIIDDYFVSFAPAGSACEARVFDHRGEVIETLRYGDSLDFGQMVIGRSLPSCD